MSKISKLRQSKNQQPTTRDWSKADFGSSTVRVPRGDKTIRSDAPPLQVVRPAWNGPVPLTFRAFPMLNSDDPSELDHGRAGGITGWSDWMRYQVPVASFVGKDEKITFIMYDPRDKKDGYDPYSNPYNKLYWGVINANKSQSATVGGSDVFSKYWPGLVDPNNYKTRCLSKPTAMNFYQGLVYEYSERQGDDWIVHTPCAEGAPLGANPEDFTPIIQIKNSAGKSLDAHLNAPIDGSGDEPTWENPVSLTDGPFISFFNPRKHGELFEEFDLDKFTSERDGFVGWGAHVSDTFLYTHKRRTQEVTNDVTEYEEAIRSSILWWDNVLHFPTHDEIAGWLALSFKSMPEVLRYCWKDDPEFFTDEVEGILGDRTTVSIEAPFEEDEADVVRPVQRKQTSLNIGATPLDTVVDDEFGEANAALLSDEEEEELDDDIFGIDSEEEDEDVAPSRSRAEERSRLRPPTKKVTPRRRQ